MKSALRVDARLTETLDGRDILIQLTAMETQRYAGAVRRVPFTARHRERMEAALAGLAGRSAPA